MPTLRHWLPAVFLAALFTTGTALAQQHGGILTASLFPEPPSLNPAVQQVQNTQVVAGKIFESLLTYSHTLEPQPSLAKSWQVSENRLTYSFQLQQGVNWHDGQPFTADDVVFTFTEILKNSARIRTLINSIESITAPDAHTVVFQLKRPWSAFMHVHDIGSGPILPKHIYQGKDLATHPLNNAPIGTGPFKFAKWERGSFIELVRNPDYWQKGLPYLDGITYRIIPDAASRRVAMEQGQIMQLMQNEYEPSDLQRLKKNPQLQSFTKGSEFWSPISWIEFNNTVAPMNDKRFRQAIMYGIDRKFIMEKILFGQGVLATGPIHPDIRFYTSDVLQYSLNQQKAIALLDDMGLKPDAKGVRAKISLIPRPYGEQFRREAEYIKQALAKIGIAIHIESVDIATWVRRMGNGEFQMVGNSVYQYGDPAIGVARTYICSNIKKGVAFSNTAQYCNQEIDELFSKAETAPDEERAALYAEIQKILAEDLPVLWLYGQKHDFFFNIRVRDAITTAHGVAGNYATAWLAPQ